MGRGALREGYKFQHLLSTPAREQVCRRRAVIVDTNQPPAMIPPVKHRVDKRPPWDREVYMDMNGAVLMEGDKPDTHLRILSVSLPCPFGHKWKEDRRQSLRGCAVHPVKVGTTRSARRKGARQQGEGQSHQKRNPKSAHRVTSAEVSLSMEGWDHQGRKRVGDPRESPWGAVLTLSRSPGLSLCVPGIPVPFPDEPLVFGSHLVR